MKKLIGIMGGTFNPIHIGHLIAAQETLIAYNLEKILFIPNRVPPHRLNDPSIAPAEDRFNMVSLATASNPLFCASRIEIDNPHISYSFETVHRLIEQDPDAGYYFITGIDSLVNYRWHKFEDLLEILDSFITVTRPGFDQVLLEIVHGKMIPEHRAKIKILKIPAIEVSSTMIRDRIAHGLPIKYLVPDGIETYIEKNHLYT